MSCMDSSETRAPLLGIVTTSRDEAYTCFFGDAVEAKPRTRCIGSVEDALTDGMKRSVGNAHSGIVGRHSSLSQMGRAVCCAHKKICP